MTVHRDGVDSLDGCRDWVTPTVVFLAHQAAWWLFQLWIVLSAFDEPYPVEPINELVRGASYVLEFPLNRVFAAPLSIPMAMVNGLLWGAAARVLLALVRKVG